MNLGLSEKNRLLHRIVGRSSIPLFACSLQANPFACKPANMQNSVTPAPCRVLRLLLTLETKVAITFALAAQSWQHFSFLLDKVPAIQ
jgi:hypothetical protein